MRLDLVQIIRDFHNVPVCDFILFFSSVAMQKKKRVGILGYGESGKYIVDCIFKDPLIGAKLELVRIDDFFFYFHLLPFETYFEAFVWNRTLETVQKDSRLNSLTLEDITQFQKFSPDLSKTLSYPALFIA